MNSELNTILVDASREYVKYDPPIDSMFDVPVDFVLSSLIEKDNDGTTWKFRKGSGSALVSKFTTANGRPIPFVSSVERGSRPCSINSSSSRSYMYKVVKCAHRNNNSKGVQACMARVTLKFSISFDEDVVRAGVSHRTIQVIWDKDDSNTPIPCIHLKGAPARGVVRRGDREQLLGRSTMPSHMTLESVRSNENAFEQLLSGNRTGLLISQSAAHKARGRGRKELYEKEGDIILDLRRIQRESWDAHRKGGFQNLPVHARLKTFLGCVHDLRSMEDGGFSALTLFSAVSLDIHRRLIESRSENANIVLMDSTQFREAEVLVSVHSDFVSRSLSRGTNLRYSEDRQYVWVKPLHTFLVIRLETGTEKDRKLQPYICAEHISIERTTGEMIKFLETYFRKLEFYIGVKAYPTFFVSDEDKAFTAAAVWVFNRMYVSEYGALMLLSSQRKDDTIRHESVRTTLVHCSVHKSRNLRDFIHDLAKERNEKKDGDVYSSLNRFSQQIYSFLRSANSYDELCHRTGAVAHILSTQRFPYVPPADKGKLVVVVSPELCVQKGSEELWRGLTPNNKPPPQGKPVHRVRLESRIGKEQLNWDLELKMKNAMEEPSHVETGVHQSAAESTVQNSSLDGHGQPLAQNGICKLSYGSFDIFVSYGSIVSVDGVDRVLVRFNCPFLSGYGYGEGGFIMLYKLCDLTMKDLGSPLWAEGRTLEFFRSSVFGNAVFLCDALTGMAPLTHNTSVEVAIRTRKHVDEIGIQMKTCAKGMRLPEYVSLRSKWIDKKNVVQLLLMIRGSMSARRRPASTVGKDNHLLHKKKKSRLTDIARSCNVKDTARLCGTVLFKGTEFVNNSSANAGKYLITGTNEQFPIPSTQLSLSQEAQTESVWSSTRGISKACIDSSKSQADARVMCFLRQATEKLRYFLSPLGCSDRLLSLLAGHIGSRSSNKISPEEVRRFLNAVVDFDCNFFDDVLNQTQLDSWFSLIESSTVWEEGIVEKYGGKCELLPFVQTRIANVKEGQVLDMKDDDQVDEIQTNHIESKKLLMEDIRLLVESRTSHSSDYKVPPRVVNEMTRLYTSLAGTVRKPVLIQDSFWIEEMLSRNISLSRLMKPSDLEFLKSQTQKAIRSASIKSWDDVDQVLCPFLVSKNKKTEKWICFAVFQSSRTISIYNPSVSIRKGLAKEEKDAVDALKAYFVYHPSPNWAGRYRCSGNDLTFPQVVSCIDSGVFVLLACRFALLGLPNVFSQADIQDYRQRFANEIYVQRAT